jgi:hypothetical protein
VYVTSAMACDEPSSTTPMSAARVNAQNNRVARVASIFENGNAALSNLVQQLGGIGIGDPPGATPRAAAPQFANSPSCAYAVRPGGLYGRRIPVASGSVVNSDGSPMAPVVLTGQPVLTSNGLALPSAPTGTVLGSASSASGNPTAVAANTNPTATASAQPASTVDGGSTPNAGPFPVDPSRSIRSNCGPNSLAAFLPNATPVPFWQQPLFWGGLLFIVGFGALTGKNK